MANGTEKLLCVDGPVRLFASLDEAEPALLDEGQLVISIHPGNHVKAQVNEVFWTLSTTAVACVRVTHHAFSFSIPECPGMYITAILPDGLPGDELQGVVDVLSATCDYHDQRDGTGRRVPPVATAPPTGAAFAPLVQADRVAAAEAGSEAVAVAAGERTDYEHADKFARMAHMAATMVHAAGQATSHALLRSADYINQRVPPAGRDASVSPATLQRLDSARRVAGRVASITGSVAEGVAKMTISAATNIASHLSDTSLGRGVANSSVSHVVVAGVSALDEVLQALEDAGLQVVQSLATATTTVVQHRYGPDAARAAGLGMGTAVHVAEAQRHLSKLRPTRIAKKTAKQVARHVAAGSPAGVNMRPIASPPAGPRPGYGPPSVLIEEVMSDPMPASGAQRLLTAPGLQQQISDGSSTAAGVAEGRPAAGAYTPPAYVPAAAPPANNVGNMRPPPTASAPTAQPNSNFTQFQRSNVPPAGTANVQYMPPPQQQQPVAVEPNYPMHPARRPGFYPNVPA